MNVRPTFAPVSAAEAAPLRREYLEQLPYAQDAFLEARINDALFTHIEARGKTIGYCAQSKDHTLLEFHLREESVTLAQTVFPKMARGQGLRDALIKSFDHLALSCALDLSREVTVKGMLVRDYCPQPLPCLPHIQYSVRAAVIDDLPTVLALEQEVFSHPQRLRSVIENREMLLFENERAVLAFGILRPVLEGGNDVEVGIAVDRPFRGKGYAAFILRDLIEHCLRSGKNPISGCSIENTASILLGQRIGLCARHRLLQVRF